MVNGAVKTTLDLPDDLMRAAKMRAASEGRKLKDIIAESLRRGLAEPLDGPEVRKRVRFPLIKGLHPARKDQEMSPERVARVLADADAESIRASS